MAIVQADLDFVLKLDESSGKTITNTGVTSGNYSILASLTENSDFSWHTNASSILSYLSFNDTSANFNYATTAATAPGTTMETVNVALKFQLAALAGGTAHLLGYGDTIAVYCSSPAGGGDFDLHIEVTDNFARTATYVFSALTFGTDYTLSWTHDQSTQSASFIRAKLNAAAVVTGSTVDHSAGTLVNAWPMIGSNASNWSTRRHYFIVYQRGGTAWTSGDLDSINADPTVLWAPPDATAPTYSVNPHVTQLDTTTATFDATASDETATTVDHYMAGYTSGSTPTAANIKAAGGTGFIAGTNKSALAVANGVHANFAQVTGMTPGAYIDWWFTVEEAGGGNLRAPFLVSQPLQITMRTAFQPNAFEGFQEGALPSSGQSAATGAATETDTALAEGRVKILPVGLASGTNTALALTASHANAAGVATETDSSQTLAHLKLRATGVAAETDAAQTLGRAKSKALGLASDTETALALSPVKVRAVGLGTETAAALALSRLKVRALGLATETDASLALGHLQVHLPGVATETDTALALAAKKVQALALSSETDSAQALTASHARTVGISSETDAALARGRIKLRGAGRADETDEAVALSALPPPDEFAFDVTEPTDVAAVAIGVVNSAEFAVTDPPDTTAIALDQPNDIHFGAINIWVQGSEAPDVAAFEMESEGLLAPPISQGANGAPRHFPPPLRPNELVMRATEAPDVCRILIEVDWSRDDEDFLQLAMEAA